MRKMQKILACATGCLMLGSCAASGSGERSLPARTIAPALVTPGENHPGWEYARNDPPQRDIRLPHHIVEIRHNETLRTINGRPREYTTTRSRSIHWWRSP